MRKINRFPLIALALMVVFSFAGIVAPQATQAASVTLLVGIVAFFVTWKIEGTKGEGLDIKRVPAALKDPSLWVLLALPTVMDLLCFVLARFALPEYIAHLKARTGFLSVGQFPLLLVELVIAALGEEIAWRGFFQKQLMKALPFWPTVAIASLLFALCHFAQDTAVIVLYDLFFIFVNSILYGLVFRKTDNAYVSTLAHFAANLVGIVWLMLF